MSKPVVVITGASQGIGAAIARVFAREVRGVRLALVARNEQNLAVVARGAAKLLSGRGAAVATFGCDVSDEASVATMAAAVSKRFGGADVLINNAGKFEASTLTEMSVAQFDRLIGANLRSVFLVSKAFVPGMAARGRTDPSGDRVRAGGGAAGGAGRVVVAALSDGGGPGRTGGARRSRVSVGETRRDHL